MGVMPNARGAEGDAGIYFSLVFFDRYVAQISFVALFVVGVLGIVATHDADMMDGLVVFGVGVW